jgi:hypothetical protein
LGFFKAKEISVSKYLSISLFYLILISCISEVKVELKGSGQSSNSAHILNLDSVSINSPDFSKDVYISIPFTGDSNNDSVVTIFFCSLKAQAGCDPSSGESIILEKSGSSVIGSLNIGTSIFTPGDFLKFKVSISDEDGFITKGNTGYIFIPHDGSIPRTIRQLGRFTFGSNEASSMSTDTITDIVKADDGSIYLAGETYSHLGEPNAGDADAFVIKIKPTGDLDQSFGIKGYWHFGLVTSHYANKSDEVSTIILDGKGSLYVGGSTYSSLGGPNAGSTDGFVIKLNAKTGALDEQFGDGDGRDNDGVLQINSNHSSDAVQYEFVRSMVIDDSNNLYLGGHTQGALGGGNSGGNYDGFIIKVDTTNGILSTSFGDGDGTDNDGIVQINSTNTPDASGWDYINSMTIDASNSLYIAGNGSTAMGGPYSGGGDTFIIKLNSTSGFFDMTFGSGDGTDNDGILQINNTNTVDATSTDKIISLQLDGAGNLFAAGQTDSSLGGLKAGERDAFIIKLSSSTGIFDSDFGDGDGADNDGVLQINATNSSAANQSEYLNSINLDNGGNIYLVGHTTSSLSSPNSGLEDGFIIKLSSSSGMLNAGFGDGDGNDDDGILHLTSYNAGDATFADKPNASIVDGNGNIFITGSTASSLGGLNAGLLDGFIAKLSTTSGLLDSSFGNGDGTNNDGIKQFNSQTSTRYPGNIDLVNSMVHDNLGNIYIAGDTWSSFGGLQGGSFQNGFIVKMNANTGEIDSEFGDGDGTDNDGVLQFTKVSTPAIDKGAGIVDMLLDGAGNIFVTAETYDDLGGPNASLQDGFVIKLDANSGVFDSGFGNGDGIDNDGILMINNINTAGSAGSRQFIKAMALDGLGNLFLAGESWGGLGGPLSGGFKQDSIIIKLNASTGIIDAAFGDGDGVNNDGIVQVNNLYATNGSTVDKVNDIKLDGLGNIYVLGTSSGAALGGFESSPGTIDGVLLKLDTINGTRDAAFGDGDGADNDGIVRINNTNSNGAGVLQEMELDGLGNIYVAGYTNDSLGGLNAGGYDIFIIKMDVTNGVFDATFGDGDNVDNDGILQINNFNTMDASGEELISSIKLDSANNLMITGYTDGSLGGPNGGNSDIFVIKIDTTNGLLNPNFGDGDGADDDGILQVNNNNSADAGSQDFSKSMTIDAIGNVFIGGNTEGSLGGGNSSTGSTDVFSIRIPLGSDGI